ncbi:MAG: S53 family peptidase [Candidatus Eremiobacteraeota bacterium]|nr:S53 family peptidase [Candidatus Eremiobacteraeota bacterium]
MTRTFLRATAVFAIAALAACHGGSIGNSIVPQVGSVPAATAGEIPLMNANAIREVCPATGVPDEMRCFALERTDLRANIADENATHQGYGPQDLQSAYKIPPGKGSKVAIVDAYGYPRAASDLAAYRKYYGLPACGTSNGCLEIRNQTGGTKPPPTNGNWDVEQALDLDMVSALCPSCKLVLVQANSDLRSDLYTAVKEAAALGAVVISNSYGIGEEGPASCGVGGEHSDPAFSGSGHVYVASAGDNGGGLLDCGGPQQPCSLGPVVCVGGTHLVPSNKPRGWEESVWNDLSKDLCSGPCGATGSGCSIYVQKPSWQHDPSCKMRSEADVAADASPFTPVAVYYNGWSAFGGTSASAPMIAGIFGRAGNAAQIVGPEHIWLNHTKLFDQTTGNNIYKPVGGDCASSIHYICYAQKGYDGPTGFGTPNGLGAF